MAFELVPVPILPLFLVTRHLSISFQPLSLPEIPPLQVCCGSWARFENEATYWNAGQRAYCPGPPRGTFLQISASCTFHDNVLSVAVIVVSVANLFVHRISTEQLHNPHAQKFLLSVANHICICCLCHCSGAHYYRIALYPMHHISMYP